MVKGKELEMECDLLGNCGFFQRYQDTLDLACRGFIKTYCKGPKMEECKRKEFRKTNGTPPPIEMLPSGQMVPKEYSRNV